MANCRGEVILTITKRGANGKPTRATFESICTRDNCCIGLEPTGSNRRMEAFDVPGGKVESLVAQKPGRTKRLQEECLRRQQAPNN